MKKEDNRVDSFFGKNQKNKVSSAKDIPKINIGNETVSTVHMKNNLTAINGIGPVIADILEKEGITTFSQLADASLKKIQSAISSAKGSHKPASWVKQAQKMSLKNIHDEKKKVIKNSKNRTVSQKNVSAKKTNRNKRDKRSVNVTKILVDKKRDVDKTKKAEGGSILVRVNNFVLVTLFFGMTLFFTNQTFQGIDFEKNIFFYMGISLVAILTSINFLLKRSIAVRKTPFDMVILAFILIYGLSAWLSVDRWHSFVGFFSDPSRGFIFIGVVVISFYLILSNFTLRTAKRALNAVVIAMVVIGLYTLISGLGLIPINLQVLVPFSLVGSLKGLAMLLSAGIPLLVISYLLLGGHEHRKRAMFFQGVIAVALLAIVVDLVMLKAFVSWIALAGGIVVLMFLLINKNGKEIGGAFGRSIVFTILLLVVLLAGWAKSDYHALMPTFSRVGLPTEVHVGLPISYEIVKGSLTSDWKQALIGSGPATFGYDFAKFSPRGIVSPVETIEYVYQGEGVLAESIPTVGLLGTFLLVLLGIIFVARALRTLNIKNETRVYLVGLFVSSIILLMNIIMSQVGGGLLILSALILALTVFFVLKGRGEENYYKIDLRGISFAKFTGVLAVIVILAGLLGGGFYATRTYLADTYFSQALVAADAQDRSENIIRAIQTRPEEGVYYMKLGQTILSTINEKKQDKENIKAQEMKVLGEQLIYYVEKGASLMPNDVKTQRFLATVYELTGTEKAEEMKKLYENIIKLDPNNVQYYIKTGDLYLLESKQGDKDEKLSQALTWYEQALNIRPRAGFIYDRIATIFYQKEDLDQAIFNVSKAAKVAPNNISYKFTLGVLYQLKGGKEDVVVAEKIFKVLLASAPQNIDVLTQLGLLYEQTGHIDEAKKQYERILTIVGENKKLEKIKEVFDKFIENLNAGKLNIENKNIDIKESNEKEAKKNDVENKNTKEKLLVGEQDNRERVIITVDAEGPINVRKEGSLSGEKLIKIMETGEFEKIGENEKWIQILIPAIDSQEIIKGWVHSKFVTSK